MNDFGKNLIVGVFVLAGLIALGAMIVIFGEAPYALTPSYIVTMQFPAAGPVRPDDPVFLNGIEIGQVKSIQPLPDIRKGVKVVCTINAKYRIPVDAVPLLREQTLALGKPAIRINVGPDNAQESLPTDDTGVLKGEVAGGIAELIPKSTIQDLQNAGRALTRLAQALEPVAHDLHELLKPTLVEEVDATTQPDKPLANVSTVVQRFDLAIKNFNRVMGDPENQRNLAVMTKNFRIVSERGLVLADRLVGLAERVDKLATSADDRLKRLSRALTDNSDKLSKLLVRLSKAADLLNSPKGSWGKFVNDPELYESLTLTTRRLQLALEDLRGLLRQWQEKGIKIEGGVWAK